MYKQSSYAVRIDGRSFNRYKRSFGSATQLFDSPQSLGDYKQLVDRYLVGGDTQSLDRYVKQVV